MDIKSNAATLIELALSKYSEDSKYRPEDANPVYIKETTYKKLNDQWYCISNTAKHNSGVNWISSYIKLSTLAFT